MAFRRRRRHTTLELAINASIDLTQERVEALSMRGRELIKQWHDQRPGSGDLIAISSSILRTLGELRRIDPHRADLLDELWREAPGRDPSLPDDSGIDLRTFNPSGEIVWLG